MMNPDQVGLEVRDAVIANALYSIPLTDNNKVLIPMVQARFDAIMKAMP
jgi:hypothetical protein